jgi:hypothetical protein
MSTDGQTLAYVPRVAWAFHAAMVDGAMLSARAGSMPSAASSRAVRFTLSCVTPSKMATLSDVFELFELYRSRLLTEKMHIGEPTETASREWYEMHVFGIVTRPVTLNSSPTVMISRASNVL